MIVVIMTTTSEQGRYSLTSGGYVDFNLTRHAWFVSTTSDKDYREWDIPV